MRYCKEDVKLTVLLMQIIYSMKWEEIIITRFDWRKTPVQLVEHHRFAGA